MGKHNDKEFQQRKKLEIAFRDHLERQLKNGIAQGVYATCKVVCDRLMDESKTLEERVKDAIAFCKPIVDRRNAVVTVAGKEEKAGEDTPEAPPEEKAGE